MIAYNLIKTLLFFYVWSTAFLERILKQTRKTTGLLLNSFSEETLYFFSDSLVPLIAGSNSSAIIRPDLESGCWSFNKNTFTFMTEESYVSRKLPYLSANLYKDGVLVSDISEWVMNIQIISSKNLPIQYLVFAWAYQNGIVLESYTTSKYILDVITIEGDEMKLDVKTA